MQEQLILLVIGFGCVILGCVIQCNELLQLARVGNISFNWKKDFIYKDYLSIIISFGAVFLWWALFAEFAQRYTWLHDFKRLSFAAIGFFGGFFILSMYSPAKKLIKKQIDNKTNRLSEMTGEQKTQL